MMSPACPPAFGFTTTFPTPFAARVRLVLVVLVVIPPFAFIAPETVSPVSVPTLVSEEFTTPDAKVVLVRVFASAVTVMLAEPSKETPLMVLGV